MEVELIEKPMKSILEEYSMKAGMNFNESTVLESLKELIGFIPLPYERKIKQREIGKLINKWFSLKMRKKYEEISPELLEIKRKIVVNEYGIKWPVEIPLLASAELHRDEGWSYATEIRPRDFTSQTVSFFSAMPRIPFEVRRVGKEALASVYQLYSEALITEPLSDILIKKESKGKNIYNPSNAKLHVVWKPKLSEIKVEVVENDPALLLKYINKLYLIATWREPEEEPFMSILSVCRNLNWYQ